MNAASKIQNLKNMKKIYVKYMIAVLLTGFMLTSCDKYLDIEPRQEISAETAITSGDDVQLLLISAYEGIKGTYGNNEGGELWGGGFNYASELLATTGDVSWVGSFEEQREYNRKAITTTNLLVRDDWIRAYEVINITNTVLGVLDVIEDADERQRIEGEAKGIRGMVYFELARFWGLPYEAGQTNNQPAVPLVLSPTVAITDVTYPSRSTVEQVFAQAITDLSDAETLLDGFGTNEGYVSTYSASAYLSRIYLQQGRYEEAAQKADRVIQSNEYALVEDPLEAFNNKSFVSEDVFAIRQTETSNHGVNNSGLSTHYASLAGQGRGDMEINSAFLDNFGPNDRRGGLMTETVPEVTQIDNVTEMYYIGIGTTNSGFINCAKYGDSRRNFPVIRLAEMYLTRAEGNFEAGTSHGAAPLEDVNTIRVRAQADPLPSVDRDAIRKERYLELCWEGLRLHDLKRWKESIDEYPYNAGNLILPIPEREMEANPDNLVQNPYYTGG
jgi:tetratricopeptide (TPR) repeat protein